MPREFKINPAVRKGDVVKGGLMAPSGGGKTFSALRLATGIQRIMGGDIGGVDTENGRMLKYADYFKYKHLDFQPPFQSLDYIEAFYALVKDGCRTIIADSMSHEHGGVGGYLEFADAELTRMAGNDFGKRKAMKLASFIEPSKKRRQMIDEIIRMKTNFLFCFRAKEKVKPTRDANHKLEITNFGFMPIAASELVFEMDFCCLLLPNAGGVPTWQSDEIGEKLMIKQALQFDEIFKEAQPLSEDIGEKLAIWARGKVDVVVDEATMKAGDAAAAKGLAALRDWYKTLSKEFQNALIPKINKDWKPAAEKVTPPPAEPAPAP